MYELLVYLLHFFPLTNNKHKILNDSCLFDYFRPIACEIKINVKHE